MESILNLPHILTDLLLQQYLFHVLRTLTLWVATDLTVSSRVHPSFTLPGHGGDVSIRISRLIAFKQTGTRESHAVQDLKDVLAFELPTFVFLQVVAAVLEVLVLVATDGALTLGVRTFHRDLRDNLFVDQLPGFGSQFVRSCEQLTSTNDTPTVCVFKRRRLGLADDILCFLAMLQIDLHTGCSGCNLLQFGCRKMVTVLVGTSV